MIEVKGISLPLDAGLPGNEGIMLSAAAKALRVKKSRISSVKLLKRSIDARKKGNIHFVAALGIELAESKPSAEQNIVDSLQNPNIVLHEPAPQLVLPKLPKPPASRPVVVGAGPAGLFAALVLARAGAMPILIERGWDVDARREIVRQFLDGGALDPQCNVQFGEGGAGTFSDGKLATNTHNVLNRTVLQWFAEAGAPEQILWQAHPHVGTDNLALVVRNLREQIISRGGDVRFGCTLKELALEPEGEIGPSCGKRLVGIRVEQRPRPSRVGESQAQHLAPDLHFVAPAPKIEEIACSHLILAMGHSARDTFEMLRDAGLALSQKPFAAGVRIEHPQQVVNEAQWGREHSNHAALGAAEYKLSCHLKDGRSVFTFCMCPGGVVIPAASEDGGVVTNGMSKFARDAQNANAALLVNVLPGDFPDADPLAGMRLQREFEQAAYRVGGNGFAAPAQLVGDCLANRSSSHAGVVRPSYARGVVWTDIGECLPAFIVDSIRQALPIFDRKLRSFAMPDAVLTAPETRSSSPVRIERDVQLQAVGHAGIYPCGEGAGYAGGIMSAAVDGIRVAQAVLAQIG